MTPALSIVIPSHCRDDLLRRCLASVAQHAPTDTEVIVVDDGSVRGTIAAAARQFAGVTVLRLPRRRGFCVAANRGIAAARAAFVEMLNDDTEVAAGWATAALAVFADPSVAAVAPLVLQAPVAPPKNDEVAARHAVPPRPDPSPAALHPKYRGERGPIALVHAPQTWVSASPLPCTRGRGEGGEGAEPGATSSVCTATHQSSLLIDSAGDRYHVGGVAGKRGHGRPLDVDYLSPCRVFGASGSSAFYRRDVLLDVGGFPESFGAYFEDVDLSFRLNRAGYQVRFEPAARVLHHVSASYGRAGRQLLEQQSLNEERVFWRNIPAAEMGWALPQHAAVLAGKAWRRWQEGLLVPFVCGRLRLLGELPALWRHRCALQVNATGDIAAWHVDRRFSSIDLH